MERVMFLTFSSCLITFSIFTSSAISGDTITPSKPLIYGQTLASSREVFELGFFSPPGTTSKNKYLGIWYKTSPRVIVWVANRDDPLVDSGGELAINGKGNLVILNTTRRVVWSSKISTRSARKPVAQILDTGNLVLRDEKNYLWESFDYPTDTLLAGMRLGWDSKSGRRRSLTSWKSADDPSTGEYSYKMEINGVPQLVLVAGSTRKFRSGTWNGLRFSGQPLLGRTVFESIIKISDDESWYMFLPNDDLIVTRISLNVSGSVQRLVLQNGSVEWDFMYSVPYQRCDQYGLCGPNGVCGPNSDPICQCLEGFAPSSPEEWEVLNWFKGCVRKTELECRKGEGFVEVVGVKLPDLLDFGVNKSMSLEECKEYCLENCTCKAYASSDVRGRGCLMWFGDLVDIREISVKGSDGVLYLRLSASEMKLIHEASKKRRLIITIVVLTTLGMIFVGMVFLCMLWRLRKSVKDENKNEDIELPLFDFTTIGLATNNFSSTSKIGEGGFGPVYKGRLSTRQEIAVKRLSSSSGQGPEEFKNEVVLISKLQHRNLVALLGCCIEGEERMLTYEYMCNKSLDSFIFDRYKSASLNWEKRFGIIMGIARGLLYLHQDSKLQIIHRDLKASNILLDEKMNPKISDFGLARIFGGDENETKTKRVIGTYGYMSPEYAIDGKFSVKSDVFSFGVVLLEIVSGRRNRGFSHPDHPHNLLGHVWLLWSQEKALELLTNTSLLEDSHAESQVLRCIQLGLLCVQKFPVDRPTMAFVVAVLANEGANLPLPKRPAFFVEQSSFRENPMLREEEFYSQNYLDTTTTSFEGR